jgi:hypothetical protein
LLYIRANKTQEEKTMLRTNEMAILKSRNVIRRHYGIRGAQEISAAEVKAELDSLNRHYAEGSLDNFYEPLYYAVESAQAKM